MTCPRCQYALTAFDKSCPRCTQMKTQRATAVAPARPQAVARPTQAVQEPAACTACGNHAIQKISGLHRGGVWSAQSVSTGVGYGRTSGGQSVTTVSTHTANSAGGTQLAQALAPPSPPQRFQTRAEKVTINGLLISVLVWLVGGFALSDPTTSPALVLSFRVVALLITVVPFAAIPFAVASAREQKADFPLVVKRWQRVIRHWEGLYYCPRCDRVFNPQTGRHASPQALSRILRDDCIHDTQTL